MNNSQFLTLHGVIYTLFALALFFIPTQMWPIYGVEINDQYALFLSQHTSIFLGGIAAICLLLRDIELGALAKKLFTALFITNLIGVVITLKAALTGIFVGLGWSDPVFFVFMSFLSFRQMIKQ